MNDAASDGHRVGGIVKREEVLDTTPITVAE